MSILSRPTPCCWISLQRVALRITSAVQYCWRRIMASNSSGWSKLSTSSTCARSRSTADGAMGSFRYTFIISILPTYGCPVRAGSARIMVLPFYHSSFPGKRPFANIPPTFGRPIAAPRPPDVRRSFPPVFLSGIQTRENGIFATFSGIFQEIPGASFGKMTKSPGILEIPGLLTMVRGTGLEPVTPCTSSNRVNEATGDSVTK